MSHAMKRVASRVAVASASIAVVAGIAATSAFAAAPTYTLTAGTVKTGSSAYTASAPGTSSKPAIAFSDTTSGTNLNCVSGTAKGAAALGAKHAAAKIATITGTTWTTCSGPLGLTLKPKQVGTWYLNGSTATTSAGVTKGYISGINATVSATTASQCTFTVTGNADGTYTNSTKKLTLAPVSGSGHLLKVSKVTGCFQQINNGDTVTFKASYAISDAQGALKIVSP